MSRPLRIEYRGAVHHLMNPGIRPPKGVPQQGRLWGISEDGFTGTRSMGGGRSGEELQRRGERGEESWDVP